METVLGSQPLEGLRLFGCNPHTLDLTSLSNKHYIWKPGEVEEFECRFAPQHKDLKPEENCTCGIWSCKSRKELIKAFPALVMGLNPKPVPQGPPSFLSFFMPTWDLPGFYVCARIEQWGVVIEHEGGYRSEFARIIPDTISIWPRAYKTKNYQHIRNVRKRYSKGGENGTRGF